MDFDYHTSLKYLYRSEQNYLYLDLMLQSTVSDQGLHCLPQINQFLHMSKNSSKIVKILRQVW